MEPLTLRDANMAGSDSAYMAVRRIWGALRRSAEAASPVCYTYAAK